MYRIATTNVPLLHSCPGGVKREQIVQDLPAAKVEKKLIELKDEAYFYFYEIKDNKHIIEEENLLFIKSNEPQFKSSESMSELILSSTSFGRLYLTFLLGF